MAKPRQALLGASWLKLGGIVVSWLRGLGLKGLLNWHDLLHDLFGHGLALNGCNIGRWLGFMHWLGWLSLYWRGVGGLGVDSVLCGDGSGGGHWLLLHFDGGLLGGGFGHMSWCCLQPCSCYIGLVHFL